jgi:hypothetical protein
MHILMSEVLSALKNSLRDLEGIVIGSDEPRVLELKDTFRKKISELEGEDEKAA